MFTAAYTATLDTDEGRFVLKVETDEDELVIDVHGCALDLAASIRRSGLLRYADEAEDARLTYRTPVTEADLEAYEPGDPKRIELQRIIDRGGT